MVTIFATHEFNAVGDPATARESTLTSALIDGRGNRAALTALALAVAVAAAIHVPPEAVVFRQHVVMRAPGDEDHAFELLERGARVTLGQLRRRLATEGERDIAVRARDFPAYYLDSLAVRFAEAGDPQRADALFQEAIDAGPRVARVHFNYGTFSLAPGDVAAARDQLDQAVRLNPHDAAAWANLGVAAARLGEVTEARRCFKRALRCDPSNRIAAENLRALGFALAPR